MRRFPRAVLFALPLAVVLTGCTGSGDATQASVRDRVREGLLANPDEDFDTEAANDIADCVARTMFESDDFTKEERNAAGRAADGDEPDPELVVKVEALVNGCTENPGDGDSGE